MKKTVSFIVALMLSLTALIGVFAFMPEQAQAASQSDLTFTINSDGVSYRVTDCKNSASGTLKIPATYNGLPVIGISDFAFDGCSNLTEIIIPDSVTSIGEGAFQYCSSLTAIDIPNSVTYIDGQAFARCRSLTSVTIPNSVTSIGSYTFTSCSSLSAIIIPNSVWSIGDYAFYGCESLREITIPDSVTRIGSSAFEECYKLTVFYDGTEARKNAIEMGKHNYVLLNATWHYGREVTPTSTPRVTPTSTPRVAPTETPAGIDQATEQASVQPTDTAAVSDQTSDIQWFLIAIVCVIVLGFGVVIGLLIKKKK